MIPDQKSYYRICIPDRLFCSWHMPAVFEVNDVSIHSESGKVVLLLLGADGSMSTLNV
ncbi:hypothetical protein PA598K_04595 [Paenibacillus sp. 598K]|nr:hypothetical protein PA598K_04595 [Paenibacillus sp. 598K]